MGQRKMADSRPVARPLSPHLQIYKPMFSMMMSITHRLTGVTLFFGSILFVWWLCAAAQSDAYFNFVQSFFHHWFGRLILFGFTWALIHHALGGIRHLIWDTGRGFKLGTVNVMSWFTILGSLLLTAAIWGAMFKLRGYL